MTTNTFKRNLVERIGARVVIAAGLALMLAGLTFAAQAGMGLSSRLADHQHTGAGDGAQLMGLNPVGNFYINTNSEGNIVIASQPSGGIFYWRPKREAFRAGFSSGSDFYDLNVGSYSWAGGYNSSAGNFGLGFGTDAHADGAASVALGYYVKATAYNSMIFGSGPGFGSPAYAVNNATGSIQFFPFTVTASTEAMLAMYRDGTARATGVWNFTSTPTINGMPISTATVYQVYNATDNTKVLKTGDVMTGPLQTTTATLTGNAFSVGGSTFAIKTGYVGIGTNNPGFPLEVNSGSGINIARFYSTGGSLFYNGNAGLTEIVSRNGGNSDFQELSIRASGTEQIGLQTSGQVTIPQGNFTVGGNSFSVNAGLVSMGGTQGVNFNYNATAPLLTLGNANQTTKYSVASARSEFGFRGDPDPNETFIRSSGYPIVFYTGSAFTNERARITAAGNMGLGTSSPAAKIHVSSGTPSVLIDGDGANKLTLAGTGNDFLKLDRTGQIPWYIGYQSADLSISSATLASGTPLLKIAYNTGAMTLGGSGAAINLGGRSQTVAYAPVYISTGSTIASTIGAARTCLTSGTMTQAGSRFVSVNGTLQASQSGAPGNMSYWLEKNGVALSTWTLQLGTGDSETFPLTYSTTSSTAGSVTYALCFLASGGTSTVNQHIWYVKED